MAHLGLHLIQNPKGTWSFVGRVPIDLAYKGNPSAEVVEHQHRLPAQYRTLTPRTWATRDAAEFDATELGYIVNK